MPKDRKRKRDEAESASLPSAKKQKRNNSEYSIIDRIVSHITGIPSRSIDDSTTLLHTYIEDNYPKEEIERLFFQDKTADTFISWISSYSYVPNFDSQEVKNWRIQTSVNARDKDGNTPLHIAAENNRDDIVTLLIKNGSDITAKNKRGDTALDIAEKNGGTLNVLKMLGKAVVSTVVTNVAQQASTLYNALTEGYKNYTQNTGQSASSSSGSPWSSTVRKRR